MRTPSLTVPECPSTDAAKYRASVERKKILLVDDHPTVRKVCELALVSNGFEVIVTHNGGEGLAVFAEQQEEIALVLADITMPVMNGIEMVRKIRDINPHSKIILMTGYDPEFAIPTVLRQVCGTLRKPFTITRLLEAIEKCLNADTQVASETTEIQERSAGV